MRKLLFPGFVIALLLLFSFMCLGDTIYLKNGEKIQASFVEIKGKQVIFKKYGGMISLPMSLVDRIESDSFFDPTEIAGSVTSESSTTAVPSTPQTQETAQGEEQQAVQGDKQQTEQEAEQKDPEAEKKKAEYWIKEKQRLNTRLAQAEDELQKARSDNFAYRYAGGAGLDRTVKQIEALEQEIAQLKADIANLEIEAKKYGIPPGVFRE